MFSYRLLYPSLGPLPLAGITVKGINSLAQTLSFNKVTPNTLTYLNISDNPLRGEEPQVLIPSGIVIFLLNGRPTRA